MWDPRVKEIKEQRNTRLDLAEVFNIIPDRFSLTDREALSGNILFHYGNLYLNRLTSAEGLKLPEHIGGYIIINRLNNNVLKQLWKQYPNQ